MPEEETIKAQLKSLVEIQKYDKQIYDIRQQLAEKPAIIKQLEEEFESSKQRLKELEEKVKSIQVERKNYELELQAKEEEIAKSNTQLSQIKTNKEYTAKMTEIESIKADKSRAEEKILLSYDDSDAASQELAKEKENVAQKEKLFLQRKKEIEDEMTRLNQEIKALEDKRQQVAPSIKKDNLELYERIMKHKEGLGIVPVNGTTCMGCFMNVTPQTINILKMHEELVRCEMCARILYSEDSLE